MSLPHRSEAHTRQPKTNPHPRIPAAWLFFFVLCCCRCFLPPGELLKSGVWITFRVPTHGGSDEQEKGDGQNGGWLRSHVEAPTCETFTRLCEQNSCASSTLSCLTHLRKLAPHCTHIDPSPIFHPFCCLPNWSSESGCTFLQPESVLCGRRRFHAPRLFAWTTTATPTHHASSAQRAILCSCSGDMLFGEPFRSSGMWGLIIC